MHDLINQSTFINSQVEQIKTIGKFGLASSVIHIDSFKSRLCIMIL